jgi:N-acetylglucosamine kinase-like BadF-type ATPase
MRYFLGADVGASKTHVLITDETGQALGFGHGGPGNHESVGYEGLALALATATDAALSQAAIDRDQIVGAGFGVAGYDWPQERPATLQTLATLQLNAAIEIVNDAEIGLMAGATQGWGIAVVSGTGCNCRGWDKDRKRFGKVTGNSSLGEHTGGSDLVERAMQSVAHAWTRRGPATLLTQAFVQYAGVSDVDELLFRINQHELYLGAAAAPIVFETASAGDAVAVEVLKWGGQELGEMVNAVVRQLDFENSEFEVVLVGSLFNGGPLLFEPMRDIVLALAPYARFVRLTQPPVTGALLLGMTVGGLTPTPAIRETLSRTLSALRQQPAVAALT